MAKSLADGIYDLGFEFYVPQETNQIFPIFPDNIIEKIKRDFEFYVWKKVNENISVARIVTSWATKKESVDKFLNLLKEIKK